MADDAKVKRVPSSKGFVKQYNQNLCISSIKLSMFK